MSRNRSTTVKKYHKILKEDKDYDWEFMLDLERFKLKRMAQYFSKSQVVSDWEIIVKEINLCIKLIDIITERDIPGNFYDGTKKLPYINAKNYKRFLKSFYNNDFHYSELRVTKALYLYNLIRTYKMRTWWD